jgi:hypothetical protein
MGRGWRKRTPGGALRPCYTRAVMLRFGAPAPDFTLPSSAGGEVTLSALRGRDVVLAFYCFDWGSI